MLEDFTPRDNIHITKIDLQSQRMRSRGLEKNLSGLFWKGLFRKKKKSIYQCVFFIVKNCPKIHPHFTSIGDNWRRHLKNASELFSELMPISV